MSHTEQLPASLGGRLRWLRERADVSARELDRLAGKNEGHLAAIETRIDDKAALATIKLYADLLGVSLDWLDHGKGRAPSKEAVLAAIDRARSATAEPKRAAG